MQLLAHAGGHSNKPSFFLKNSNYQHQHEHQYSIPAALPVIFDPQRLQGWIVIRFLRRKRGKAAAAFQAFTTNKVFHWLLSTFICCFLSASSSLFGRVLVWSLNTSLRANNFGRFYSIQSFVCGRGGKITCMLHHCHHHYFHHGFPANSPHDKIPPWWEYVINR